MHKNENWAVTVFECEPKDCSQLLIKLSEFLERIPETKSYHYLVRGREDDKPVFSLRIFRDQKDKNVVKEMLEAKLRELHAQRLEVDPQQPTEFWLKYNKWTPITSETIANRGGEEAWKMLCDILHGMTKFAIDLAKKNWFDSEKRQEIAHLMTWMLGCTEGIWQTPNEVILGYFDRIDGKEYFYSKMRKM